MNLLPPINFKNWIEENRHLLKPPVGNKVVYENSDFMIMVVGGPNSRKDYHVDPVEEFFYQIEGDMVLKVMNDHNRVDIPIVGRVGFPSLNILGSLLARTRSFAFSRLSITSVEPGTTGM